MTTVLITIDREKHDFGDVKVGDVVHSPNGVPLEVRRVHSDHIEVLNLTKDSKETAR